MENEKSLQVEIVRLKEENRALKQTITSLLAEIDSIRQIDRSRVVRMELTPEQRILEMQIHYLEQISAERALTLEETRALDLHIKNKRMLDDSSSLNADFKNLPEGTTEADLLRIAGDVEIEKPKKSKGRNKSQAGD